MYRDGDLFGEFGGAIEVGAGAFEIAEFEFRRISATTEFETYLKKSLQR